MAHPHILKIFIHSSSQNITKLVKFGGIFLTILYSFQHFFLIFFIVIMQNRQWEEECLLSANIPYLINQIHPGEWHSNIQPWNVIPPQSIMPIRSLHVGTHNTPQLGVLIDISLKYGKHISICVKKANRMPGTVKGKLSGTAFYDKFLQIIRPHLEYCSWNLYQLWHVRLIEGVQRRFTLLIPGLRELPYEIRREAESYYNWNQKNTWRHWSIL